MCDICGWTNGMTCPECAKGCGCEYRCTGWRHREADDDFEEEGSYCTECGANSHYECSCDD